MKMSMVMKYDGIERDPIKELVEETMEMILTNLTAVSNEIGEDIGMIKNAIKVKEKDDYRIFEFDFESIGLTDEVSPEEVADMCDLYGTIFNGFDKSKAWKEYLHNHGFDNYELEIMLETNGEYYKVCKLAF